MSVSDDYTSCSSCGGRIDEPPNTPLEARSPCPDCGSTARTFNVHVHDSATLREKIGMKHKRPGHKKPIFESVSGDDLHRKSGQWNHITREIDRENDRYKEVIVNPATGETIRQVEEPLSEHVGRGSAKIKNNPPAGGDA